MAKQDDWVRLTVRMPPDLYEQLQDAVAHGARSMNAEIVDRLYGSFEGPRLTDHLSLDRDQAGKLAEGFRQMAASSIPLGGGVTVYFSVDDAEATAARRKAAEVDSGLVIEPQRKRTKPNPKPD